MDGEGTTRNDPFVKGANGFDRSPNRARSHAEVAGRLAKHPAKINCHTHGTGGLAAVTSDVGRVRRPLGGRVETLKGGLAGSAARLGGRSGERQIRLAAEGLPVGTKAATTVHEAKRVAARPAASWDGGSIPPASTTSGQGIVVGGGARFDAVRLPLLYGAYTG